jgi:hypothetical protein
MENNIRLKKHQKNAGLEAILDEMFQLLGPVQREIIKDFSKPDLPVFLLLGCARSGSTVINQYLAGSGFFSYPTNILSRFFYAPYIGARIQQMLIDFDIKGEIFDKKPKEQFASLLGKTYGPLGPNEFWYFWDRFFKFGELQQLTPKELAKVDWTTLLKELHSIEHVFNKPLLLKATKMGWHLNAFKANLPNVHFIDIKREVLYNAQSLLLARKEYFGSIDQWYSLKPKNYFDLIKLDPIEQVVLQVIHTNKETDDQLKLLKPRDFTTIQYADFFQDPKSVFEGLLTNANLSPTNQLLETGKIQVKNQRKVDHKTFKRLQYYTDKHSS